MYKFILTCLYWIWFQQSSTRQSFDDNCFWMKMHILWMQNLCKICCTCSQINCYLYAYTTVPTVHKLPNFCCNLTTIKNGPFVFILSWYFVTEFKFIISLMGNAFSMLVFLLSIDILHLNILCAGKCIFLNQVKRTANVLWIDCYLYRIEHGSLNIYYHKVFEKKSFPLTCSYCIDIGNLQTLK